MARGSSIFPASPSPPPPSAETRDRRGGAALRRGDGGGSGSVLEPNGAARPRDGIEEEDAAADIIASLWEAPAVSRLARLCGARR